MLVLSEVSPRIIGVEQFMRCLSVKTRNDEMEPVPILNAAPNGRALFDVACWVLPVNQPIATCEHVLHMYVIIGGGGRAQLATEKKRKANDEKAKMLELKKQAKLDKEQEKLGKQAASETAAASKDLYSGLAGFKYTKKQISITLPLNFSPEKHVHGNRFFKYITRRASSDGLCDTTTLTSSSFTKGSDL